MISLRDLFKKQTGFLRAWKGAYVINNLLNTKKLKHNRELYEEHQVKKSIYAPIGSKDFGYSLGSQIPWLDVPGVKVKLAQSADFQSFEKEVQDAILCFVDKGYLILRGFYSEEKVDMLNEEVDRLLSNNETGFNYTGRKVMDAYRFSPLIDKDFFRNEKLLHILDFMMGKKVIPFQTINFIVGSEQRAHSDSIHMTTQPPGYLIASWVALEDIHEGNGPLFYYPESHRLPYVMTQDYDSGNSKYFIGKESNKRYEDKIEEVVKEAGLKKEHFHARKGDILIWHANLLHGGEAITQTGATRRSMVSHYFCKDVICYHEISQRPAMISKSNEK